MQTRSRSLEPARATTDPTTEPASQKPPCHVNLLRSDPAFIIAWAGGVPRETPSPPSAAVPNPASTDSRHSKPATARTCKRKRHHSVETGTRQPLPSPVAISSATGTRTRKRPRALRAASHSMSQPLDGNKRLAPRSKTGLDDGGERSSSRRGSPSPVKEVMEGMRTTRRGRLKRRAGDTGTSIEANFGDGDMAEERSDNTPYAALGTPSFTTSVSFPPPESTRTAASSPTRNQRRNLQFSEPSVSFLPIESLDVPAHVNRLLREFIQDKEVCIPLSLKPIIEKELPSTVIPAVAYDNTLLNLTPDHEQHWSLTKSILEAAAQSQADNTDENGWYKVVRPVLESSFEKGIAVYHSSVTDVPTRPHLYSVLEAQTVSIEPRSLAPRFAGSPIPFKKVDFTIAFNKWDAETRQLYGSVFKSHPKLTLSQTEDASVGYTALLATLEVKSPDGTYNAASVQLATWWAAGLEKMRQLACLPILDEGMENDDAANDDLMPFVGWTVVGHRWDLHIAVKKQSGGVSIYGPVPAGDTSTCYGIFQILHVLARVNEWGRRVYYPWLVERVLGPLIRGST